MMKQLSFFLGMGFLLLFGHIAQAQQQHFIFFQNENRQPFYVMMNKKNYSSTTNGYLILPKLTNGEYALKIGFAKSENDEQEYQIKVEDKEQGFLIKSFNDKGWGLFNLQTYAVQYSGETAKLKDALAAEAKAKQQKDAEEKLAASKLIFEKHTSDSIALEKQKRYEDSVAIAGVNKQTEDETPTIKSLVVELPIVEKITAENKVVTPEKKAPFLLSKNKSDSGITYHYVLDSDTGFDTVNVFIKTPSKAQPKKEPKPETTTKIEAQEPVKNPQGLSFLNIPVSTDTAANTNPLPQLIVEKPSTTKVAANQQTTPKLDTAGVTTQENKEQTGIAKINNILPNSNCIRQADEKDFFALRKKIVAKNGTDEMIMAAKKGMKEKCYTTEQIRNLCGLFLTDAERYQFLDTAYPFVYDAANYKNLGNLLIDKYYAERFRVMIHQ